MSYYPLSYIDLALTASLILINGAISIALRLNMGRTLLLASVRTICQLLLVGLILDWIFSVDRWYLVLAMLSIMTLIAAHTAAARGSAAQQFFYGCGWKDEKFRGAHSGV